MATRLNGLVAPLGGSDLGCNNSFERTDEAKVGDDLKTLPSPLVAEVEVLA